MKRANSPPTEPDSRRSVDSVFRRRLLDSMAAAIRDRGYRDATVADVVGRAHTSRRTFYEHFADKADCFRVLLKEHNDQTVDLIERAVDPTSPWQRQVRQAVRAWIDASGRDPAITLAWIRDLSGFGDTARTMQRSALEPYVAFIEKLTTGPEFAAAGVRRASPELALILVGGLRELTAITMEDGRDIADVVEVCVQGAIGLLRPANTS